MSRFLELTIMAIMTIVLVVAAAGLLYGMDQTLRHFCDGRVISTFGMANKCIED